MGGSGGGGLRGEGALVTGAGRARGVGRAGALRLAADGARGAVNDLCRSADTAAERAAWQRLNAVADEVEAVGSEGYAVRADVGDAAQVEALVGAVLERFGRLDILVNNAGLALVKPAVETGAA